MRVLKLVFIILFLQLTPLSVNATEPVWIRDSTKGCQLWGNLQPKETFTWSGNCVEGKAEGLGTIVVYSEGIPSMTLEVTGENGLRVVAGELDSSVAPNDVRFVTRACERDFRVVDAFVKKGLALYNNGIRTAIQNMAAAFAQSSCPSDAGFNNISVNVYLEGDQHNPNAKSQIYARSTSKENRYKVSNINDIQWSLHSNEAWSAFANSNKERYNALLAKRQTDNNLAELQRQGQIKRSLDQKAQAFADKYGATGGWVKWERLKSNPFSYQDQILLFNTDFSSMITPTSGIFENIVVSDIPKNAFTHRVTVMLAGKVLGTTNVKNKFGGEVSIPHVRYLGHMVCPNSDCGGLFHTTIRGN